MQIDASSTNACDKTAALAPAPSASTGKFLPAVLFLIHAWLFLTGSAQAQDRKCPNPEFNDKPAFCGQSSLLELEKSQYLVVSRGLIRGVAGYYLSGEMSSVRLKSAPDFEFVIKVNPGTDPTSVVDLLEFKVEKGKRVYITTKATLTGAKATIEKLPYQVKKIADGIYVLSVSNLKPGEYFFGGTEFMFAFGIDR